MCYAGETDLKPRKQKIIPSLVHSKCLINAAAAKSLQSYLTLCDPIDGSPPGSHLWDSPGKNTRVGCHCLLQCMEVKGKSLSCVRLFTTPWTAAYQAPPSMGFSRQEYWSGVFSLINASCYYYFRHLNILLLKAEEFSKAAFNQPFVLVDIGFLPLIKSFVSE